MGPCLEAADRHLEAFAEVHHNCTADVGPDNQMECCSDVHRHQDNHCLVDHNHLDHPFASHSSFQEEVVDPLGVHHHSHEAFAEVHLEAFVVVHLVAVHLYCYTSCVAEAPSEDAGANNYCREVRLPGVLMVGRHQKAVRLEKGLEAVQPRPSLTGLPSVDCHLAV